MNHAHFSGAIRAMRVLVPAMGILASNLWGEGLNPGEIHAVSSARRVEFRDLLLFPFWAESSPPTAASRSQRYTDSGCTLIVSIRFAPP